MPTHPSMKALRPAMILFVICLVAIAIGMPERKTAPKLLYSVTIPDLNLDPPNNETQAYVEMASDLLAIP